MTISLFVKSVCVLRVGFLIMLLTFTVPLYAKNETSMDRIKRTKVLRAGVISSAIPYFDKNNITNEWTGFGSDLSRKFAQHLGVEIKFIETTWGNAVMDLQSNKIDIMFGMAETPVRRNMIDFSSPVFQNTYTMLCKKGYPVKDWNEFNSSDVKVSVDLGSSMDNFITPMLPMAKIMRFDNTTKATMALQAGRVDCQVLVILQAQSLLNKYPDIGSIQVPNPILTAPVSIGLQREINPDFKDTINSWIESERSNGHIKNVILKNAKELSAIEPDAFPASVKF